MRPRLQRVLRPDRLREALTPPVPRPFRHNVLDCLRVHQPRVAAHIVEDRGQLQHLAESGNGASGADILVADDGLDDGVVLRLRGGERGEERGGHEGAVELEREERGAEVGRRGADVVEQARQGVGAGGDGPVRELGAEDDAAWDGCVRGACGNGFLRFGKEEIRMMGDND